MKTLAKVILGLIIALIVAAGIFGVMLYQTTNSPVGANGREPIQFTIELGTNSYQINAELAELGLIRNARLANLVVRLHGWSNIQAGEYELSFDLSLREIYALFKGGNGVEATVLHRVTIPEGETLPFIAGVMAPVTGLTAAELLTQWGDPEFLQRLIADYWFLTEAILADGIMYPLEGYLYPLTYDFINERYEVDELTRKLLDVTATRLEPVRGLIETSDFTVHEVFTFASIIEAETQNKDQMADVAGVFYNRLKMGIKLQSCATVQYILAERVTHVTYEMTFIDSPFNTYLYEGLSIGPVNSPSIGAIRAALEPASHGYLFFIGDIFHCIDGKTHFFTNFDDHQEFTRNYLQPSYDAGENVCR